MQTETSTAPSAPPHRVHFKSSRRTQRKPQAKTLALFDQVRTVTALYALMTVRQLFYQMTTRGYVEKTERGYQRVADATVKMRRGGLLPYNQIVDGGRVRRRPPSWNSMAHLLYTAEDQFRLNYWEHQPELVEIWCEKDALAGVIMPVTEAYGVTFVALKGFGSLSIAYESGKELRRVGKPVNIYYYGDHDPAGWAVSQAIEAELRDHVGDFLRFTRVGLNPEQIARYSLPTRPTKPTDKRNAAFVTAFGSGQCVELDALPPDELTGWVKRDIKRHIDEQSWARVELSEEKQRASLSDFLTGLEDLELEEGDEDDENYDG